MGLQLDVLSEAFDELVRLMEGHVPELRRSLSSPPSVSKIDFGPPPSPAKDDAQK